MILAHGGSPTFRAQPVLLCHSLRLRPRSLLSHHLFGFEWRHQGILARVDGGRFSSKHLLARSLDRNWQRSMARWGHSCLPRVGAQANGTVERSSLGCYACATDRRPSRDQRTPAQPAVRLVLLPARLAVLRQPARRRTVHPHSVRHQRATFAPSCQRIPTRAAPQRDVCPPPATVNRGLGQHTDVGAL